MNAQTPSKHKKTRTGSFWACWGYNEEWFTGSNVHITQPALGNDYQLVHVTANDHLGWDYKFFKQPLTIPQYNYRIGYYFNEKQDWGIEGNFDHTKYIISNGQYIFQKGIYHNEPVNQVINFSQTNGDYYYLNNGANFLLFNIVKRFGLLSTRDNKLRIDGIGRAGIGPVIPHVQNSLFGQANDPHFQFGGWNTGLETSIRVTFLRYLFLEFSQKVDFAAYSNLKLYEGTARQNFGTYEIILVGGIFIPTTHHNPLFMSNVAAAPAGDTQ